MTLDFKIILLIVLLISNHIAYGQMTDSQTQINTKKISDLEKMIKQLINEIENLKNSQSQTTNQLNKIKKQQTDQTSYNKQQDTKIQNINKSVNAIQSNYQNLKDQMPKTMLYDNYNDENWSWVTTPNLNQILTHPKTAKINIQKKSLVTFIVNGHIYTSHQQIQVFFLKDKQPIVQKINLEYVVYFNSYFNFSQDTSSMDLVQETIIEPGVYLFELGMVCIANCEQKFVYMNGVGFTIKVQELS